MRSHSNSNGALRRGHRPVPETRRQVNVDVDAGAAAGWPLGRHGKHLTTPKERTVASRAGDFLKERHGITAQTSSRPPEKPTIGALGHEVDGLIQRQFQFAFLKPCRQLEKHYANVSRNGGQCHAGNISFRHSSGTDVTEEAASASTEPRESRSKLENSKPAECRVQDTTVRDFLSAEPVERVFRKPALDHQPRVLNPQDHDATRVTSSDPSALLSGESVKCKEEEEPDRPQSIAAAAERALARKLSRDGIELNSFVERKSDSAKVGKEHWQDVGMQASPRRSASERYSARGWGSSDTRWRISSTRCSIHEKEAHIDLVAPAAAKFLVETADSPAKHQYNTSPPTVAVPFKWEHAPGRAKFATPARRPDTLLQLPPRLVVPTLQRSSNGGSFSRVSVVSHPLAGFFPCMMASSSPQASKSKQSHQKVSKSFSQPLASTGKPLNAKPPRRIFSSELKPSHPWIQGYGGAPPSDPTSMFHSCSRHSSFSRTYMSCELDTSTPRTADSKSSSSISYESIGEDFDLGKTKSREGCTPTPATYLDAAGECPISSSLLDKHGAPTSSGYLNSNGEPIPLNSPDAQFAIVSPERPTRLPYKMPSVEEQERASRIPSHNSSSSATRKGSMDLCHGSPAVNLLASRRHRHSARNPPWPNSPKPHRRVQFILSICKTLKRVLFRQQPRRSVIGTRLMYHDERAPTTFQFSKPN